VEGEVLKGVERILEEVLDPQRLAKLANAELDRAWKQQENGADQGKRLKAIEAKEANIRQAIEDGLADASWANSRLEELRVERAALEADGPPLKKPPRLDAKAVAEYTGNLRSLLEHARGPEGKELIRLMVEKVALDPEERAVEIVYRAPELVMNGVVAGALSVAIHNILEGHLRKVVPIRRTRRRRGPDGPPEYPRIQRIPIRPNAQLDTILDRVLERSA
jgi:hypothetical protein